MAQKDVALDWDMMTAYVAPEELPSEVTDSKRHKDGMKACALTYPFIYSLDRF